MIDSKPWFRDIPADRVSFRSTSALEMLAAQPRLTYDQLLSYKWSNHVELADRILPELQEAVAAHGSDLARQAAAVLSRWDRTTQAESRGALLFLNWSDRKGAVSGYADDGFAVAKAPGKPFETPDGLADPKAAAEALDAAAKDMLATFGALDAPWGQVMRLKIGAIDLPANGGPGRLGIFDVVDFAPLANGHAPPTSAAASSPRSGSTSRRARAKVLLSYGNASQPGTPHDTDQLPLLARQQLRDAWRERADIEANLESRDTF